MFLLNKYKYVFITCLLHKSFKKIKKIFKMCFVHQIHAMCLLHELQ